MTASETAEQQGLERNEGAGRTEMRATPRHGAGLLRPDARDVPVGSLHRTAAL